MGSHLVANAENGDPIQRTAGKAYLLPDRGTVPLSISNFHRSGAYRIQSQVHIVQGNVVPNRLLQNIKPYSQ